MDELEALRKAIDSGKDELAKLQTLWQVQQKQFVVELMQLKAAQAVHETNRQQISALIDADTLFTYQELKKRKGLAVAKVEQGICQGCRIYPAQYRPAAGEGRRCGALQQLRPDYLSRLKNYEINH